MAAARQILFERGNRCLRSGQLRSSPRNIEIGGEPSLIANASEIERLLLRFNVAPHNIQAFLNTAHLEVIATDLCEHRDQDVPPALFSSSQIGGGRVPFPSQSPQDIKLPPSVETKLKKGCFERRRQT